MLAFKDSILLTVGFIPLSSGSACLHSRRCLPGADFTSSMERSDVGILVAFFQYACASFGRFRI